MNRVITYVMSHPAHLPYLVVSLRSLRRHWKGPVYVHAWPESFEFVEEIAEDADLDIVSICWEPKHKGKNAQFESKQLVAQAVGWRNDSTILYLDADTLIAGDLTPLFEGAEQTGFLATQFCQWNTRGGIVQGRIKRLQAFPEIEQRYVEEVLTREWPSVNGGVFCCRPDSPALAEWHEWTKIVRSIFISDETALHAIMPKHVWANQMDVLCGGEFNCSARGRLQPKTLADKDVKIWHFHGDCNTRPKKAGGAIERWWPEYQECLRDNVGGIADWRKDMHHKYLDKLEVQLNAAGDSWQERLNELVQEVK